MALVTVRALGAEAEGGKDTTNGSGRRDMNMGITACNVRAVAAEEVRARRHAVVCHVVRHVTVVSIRAGAASKEVLADGDSAWIVAEPAAGAERTRSCRAR